MNNAVSASFDDTVKLIIMTPNEDAILLCGDHGIGKSASVFAAGEEIKNSGMDDYFVNDVRLAGKEPGDIIGLLEFYEEPVLDENGNPTYDENGKPIVNKLSRHCPPAWWAPYFNPNCKGILFLDEINRAHRDVRQGLFQLILDRQLNGNKLPDGVKIVAAINDSEDYDTETLDPAFRSRWRIINFAPTQNEWLGNVDLHPLIFGFISDNKTLLESPKKEVDTVSPDRRSWAHLSKALEKFEEQNYEIPDEMFKMFAAMYIGQNAATALAVYRQTKTVVTGEKVLKKYESYKKFINFRDVGSLSKISGEIQDIIKSEEKFAKNNTTAIENLIKFMTKLPLEVFRPLYDSIAQADLQMLNVFVKYQKENKEFGNKMRQSIDRIAQVG